MSVKINWVPFSYHYLNVLSPRDSSAAQSCPALQNGNGKDCHAGYWIALECECWGWQLNWQRLIKAILTHDYEPIVLYRPPKKAIYRNEVDSVKTMHLTYFYQPQALSKSNSKCFHIMLNLHTLKCPCWYYWKLLIFQTSATENSYLLRCTTPGKTYVWYHVPNGWAHWTFDWTIKALSRIKECMWLLISIKMEGLHNDARG